MNKALLTAVAGSIIAGSAMADVTIELGNFDFTPGGFQIIEVENLTGTLTGWDLSFDYLGNGDASWSMDALFAVQGANGFGVEAGGFNVTFGFPTLGDVGTNNGNPGSFFHSFTDLEGFDVSGTGTWSMYVGDGWSSGSEITSYHNVVFTLYGVSVVPTPGALALLGLAGLAARRRRRG